MTPVIELLARHHKRERFSCGVPELTTYLKQFAAQDMRRRVAACYVLCDAGGTRQDVIGYYTLSASHVDVSNLPVEVAHQLPHYPFIPTALIGRLAVHEGYQGQRLGELLLADALKRVMRSEVAAYAVEVDAIDEGAARFYEHFGFLRLADDALHLYLPLGNLRMPE